MLKVDVDRRQGLLVIRIGLHELLGFILGMVLGALLW